MPAEQRIKELDVFRGIAAVSVMLYHYTYDFSLTFPRSTYAAPVSFPHFNLGIELFFIISGYVIYMTIDRNSNVKNFIISRFSRLYPAYWVSVLLGWGLAEVLKISELQVPLKDFIWNITMFQAFPTIHVMMVQKVYWTLGVELCFYIFVLAGLITGLHRRPLAVIAGVMVIMIITNFIYLHHGMAYYQPVFHYLFLYNSLPLFCIGILIYLHKKGETPIIVAAIIVLCLVSYIMVKDVVSIIAVCVFIIMFLSYYKGLLGWIVNPVTVFFGTISYSLYLVHQNLGYIMLLKLSALGLNSTLVLLLTMFGAILLASLVTYTVEKPARKAIRRWLA